MSKYDFIIDGIRFSYSSLSSFETCAYGWKLNYIDAVSGKMNNFFSDYGKLTHLVFEKYFLNELDSFELGDFYKKNYDLYIKESPPPNRFDMAGKYREQGQIFFDFMPFSKDDYDVLSVESSIKLAIDGAEFVAKPDLVVKEKSTGKTVLIDYKTSTPFITSKITGKVTQDKKKFEGYIRQLYIYAYALRVQENTKIDEMRLWFPRADREVVIAWNEEDESKAIAWLNETIEKIKNENDFKFDNTSEYFCRNLCGVRANCPFWK